MFRRSTGLFVNLTALLSHHRRVKDIWNFIDIERLTKCCEA